MKDTVWLVTIAFYFLISGLLFTYLVNDPSRTQVEQAFQGNLSRDITVNSSNINISDVGSGSSITSTIGYLDMLFRLITFRIPTWGGSPPAFIFLIEVFNFLLVAIFGIVFYRQVRHGGG